MSVLEPSPLSAKDHELLSYMEQEYLTNGYVPTKDKCVQEGVTTGPAYDKALKSTNFRHALVARGITLKGIEEGGPKSSVLTEEQLIAANTMLDLTDNRSRKKKLMDLGISTTKWEGWLRDPSFQHYIRTRSENLLGDNIHESHLALIDRVKSGDINAIKYFNEITGRYVPNANDKADVNAVLMMVLEVIQRHVKDPAALGAIGDELVAIGKKNAPASMGRGRIIEGSALAIGPPVGTDAF